MALDFAVLVSLALVFYACDYSAMRWRSQGLDKLISVLPDRDREARSSFVMRWAFRGRSDRQERLAHIFTLHPPLMFLATFLNGCIILLIALAILHIPTSIGALLTILLLVYPFYHATDSFEMYLLSRAAQRVGPSEFSGEDKAWLVQARTTTRNAVRYMRNLSLLMVLILLLMVVLGPLVGKIGPLGIPWPGELMSFVLMVLGIAFVTFMSPHIGVGGHAGEPWETLEFGVPLSEPQYGMQATHDAHISRLVKRHRVRNQSSDKTQSQVDEQSQRANGSAK